MDIQTILTSLANFIGTSLVYLAMGVAFLFFVWNAFRYFILGGDSKDGREKAKTLAIWGILAFVLIVSLFGVVRFLQENLGLDNGTPITPDYMQERGGGSNTTPTAPSTNSPFPTPAPTPTPAPGTPTTPAPTPGKMPPAP